MEVPMNQTIADTGNAGITGVQTVAIPVANQERALAFYVGILGFAVRRDAAFGPGNRWIEVGAPGSTTTIALPPIGDLTPGVDTGIRLTTPNAAAFHDALARGDVDVSDVLEFGPGVPPMFTMRDPDGNTLYVVEAASTA
jgi:catechol 2,3-dioxygenase-like lactoylglutathione lyase family enzyme